MNQNLDDMLMECGWGEFPNIHIERMARARHFKNAEELGKFIDFEKELCDIGDELPDDVRKLGHEKRREVALHMYEIIHEGGK